MSMVNLNNVYNHYSTQLVPQKNSKSSSHDKDDLKSLYNHMVKENSTSPFYKFTFTSAAQAYTIGIKEAAMALNESSEQIAGAKDNMYESLKAVSDNENIVYANMNSNNAEGLPQKLTVKVDALAKGQTNVGKYLSSGESSFKPGDYSFGIAVGDNQFTFRIGIHSGDTNLEIQRNLAGAINDNNIGVRATVRNNRVEGTSALVIRSEATGMPNKGELFFGFDQTYLEGDLTEALGIDQVTEAPGNAEFEINDVPHSSISNRISLNHAMDLDLLSVSEEPVNVYLVPDEEKVTDKFDSLIGHYNKLMDLSRNGVGELGATKLFRDVTSIVDRHREELTNAGITVDDNGYISRKDEEADMAAIQRLFDESPGSFRSDVKRITDKMTLNPLNYIDKVVVTYPNTDTAMPNPYNPSNYSGLLYNDYA